MVPDAAPQRELICSRASDNAVIVAHNAASRSLRTGSLCGSEGGARTHDPLINSQLLCQLSYLRRREPKLAATLARPKTVALRGI